MFIRFHNSPKLEKCVFQEHRDTMKQGTWELIWNVRFQVLSLRNWFWIINLLGSFLFCMDPGSAHSSTMLETVCAAANWQHIRRTKLIKIYFPPIETFSGSDVHCCQCKHSPSVHAAMIFFSRKNNTLKHIWGAWCVVKTWKTRKQAPVTLETGKT